MGSLFNAVSSRLHHWRIKHVSKSGWRRLAEALVSGSIAPRSIMTVYVPGAHEHARARTPSLLFSCPCPHEGGRLRCLLPSF